MTRQPTRDELVQLVEAISEPAGTGLSSEEVNQMLLEFCINCPDPAAAMDLIVEDTTPLTSAELVDKALAMPPRDVREVPASELAITHPLRYMKPS